MNRQVLILGSIVVFSGLMLGETLSQNSENRSSRWLQLVSATQQTQASEPDKHENAKQNKKARKQQEKAEKQRRKQEEKERQKQLKKEQQQASKERKKEIKKENQEIAKQQKKRQKEEMNEAKKRGDHGAREQARSVPPPPPPQDRDRDRDRNVAQAQNTPPPPPQDRDRDHDRNLAPAQNTPPPPQVNNQDRDRAAHDRDDQYRRDQDKDRDRIARDRDDQYRKDQDRDRDRDRQNTTQAQSTPPPPVVNNGNQAAPDRDDQYRRDRDDRYRRDQDKDRDRDRIARDRDDQYRRDHDRDYDRDRDRQNVAGTPVPGTPPAANNGQDQDRDRIARDRDDQYRRDHDRDYDRDRMAYDRDDQYRRDYDRDRDRDRDGYRRDRDYARNDYDRDRRIERHGPGGMRRPYDIGSIPVVTNPAPGALQAQRKVSQAIYSQLPSSNVMVLLNNNNQIVLRGSATSPGLRSRLLQLAGAAAGGYSIVDQLASDAVSSAAGSAASAAVGGIGSGIGSLVHGSGSSDSGYNGYSSGSSNSGYSNYPSSSGGSVASNTYGSSGSSGSYYASNPSLAGLQPGTNGCVNVYNSQVVITGQAASQTDADALRQVAQQLGGANTTIVNQLTVNGSPVANSTSTMANSAASSSLLSPGSVVCMNADNNNQVLLTGSVASAGELGTVERTLQPMVGKERLVDQINTPNGTVASAGSGASAASNSGTVSASSASPAVTQTRVQEAVHSLPRLSNVDAEVSANQVRLSGSVPSRDDDDDARDIAQQYAPGYDVVDNLTISGAGSNTSSLQDPSR
jgi:osmotically-inducible protein OsmY